MRILDDNPFKIVIENWARNQREIEIAQNMLRRGRSYKEISEDTGLSVDRIAELDSELQTQVV